MSRQGKNYAPFTAAEARKMREFDSGANRDNDDGKLDFDGFFSPAALESFAQYMHTHRQTTYGYRDSDNWQRGIPLEEYRKSAFRHFFSFWKHSRLNPHDPGLEDDLCGLWFNVQGYLHELLGANVARRGMAEDREMLSKMPDSPTKKGKGA